MNNIIAIGAVLIALVIWTGECKAEWFLEIGAGANGVMEYNDWEGKESLACMIGGGWAKRTGHHEWSVAYRHHSHCFLNWPFNNKEEDTLDSIGAYWRIYL